MDFSGYSTFTLRPTINSWWVALILATMRPTLDEASKLLARARELQRTGRIGPARPMLEDALDILRRLRPTPQRDTLMAWAHLDLAALYKERGNQDWNKQERGKQEQDGQEKGTPGHNKQDNSKQSRSKQGRTEQSRAEQHLRFGISYARTCGNAAARAKAQQLWNDWDS